MWLSLAWRVSKCYRSVQNIATSHDVTRKLFEINDVSLHKLSEITDVSCHKLSGINDVDSLGSRFVFLFRIVFDFRPFSE